MPTESHQVSEDAAQRSEATPAAEADATTAVARAAKRANTIAVTALVLAALSLVLTLCTLYARAQQAIP